MRPAAFLAADQLVLQLHIGKRTAHEHFMIATTRTVRVEIGILHAIFAQVARSRRIRRNSACGGNVVGGNEVAELRQHVSVLHGARRTWLKFHLVEIRRLAHVRRGFIPSKQARRLHAKAAPRFAAFIQILAA